MAKINISFAMFVSVRVCLCVLNYHPVNYDEKLSNKLFYFKLFRFEYEHLISNFFCNIHRKEKKTHRLEQKKTNFHTHIVYIYSLFY